VIIFELAYNLGMTIDEISEMPHEALLGWLDYFERRPVGWREDYRTFLFLKTQGFKGKPEEVFQSLRPIFNPPVDDDEKKAAMKTFKGSQLFNKITKAKGGKVLDL